MRAANTTTKRELIERIAEQTGQRRIDVKRIVECLLQNVVDEMRAGRRLELREFGVFETHQRSARLAQNPKTLEPVAVPAKKTVRFKTGRLLKDAVNNIGEFTVLVSDGQ